MATRKPRNPRSEVSDPAPDALATVHHGGAVIEGEVLPGRELATTRPKPLARSLIAPERPLSENPAAVYLAGLGVGSRRTMHGALCNIARLLMGAHFEPGGSLPSGEPAPAVLTGNDSDPFSIEWAAVRFAEAAAAREALAPHRSPATVNKHLAALRGVLRAAWQLGQMDSEAYHRARDVKDVKNTTLPAGRALSTGDLYGLFHACAQDKNKKAGARDAALLALLYGVGLRRSEAIALNLADYEAEGGGLTIKRAKGNKDRTGYALNGARDALAAWLTHRGEAPGPLFLPIAKGGAIGTRRLTDEAVRHILQSRAAQAGIKHVSPHDMRRTFVSNLLDAGADIATVQKMAGHSSVNVTARYDRRGEAVKQKAAELLYVPFQS